MNETTALTQNHPITPPPELRRQWQSKSPFKVISVEREDYMIDCAARWGADMELEACCEWLDQSTVGMADLLHTARRPKPPTLNSIALQMLGTIERDAHYIPEITDTIRKALEALPE